VNSGRLEEKTRKFYGNGSRLLKTTPVADMRVNQITGDLAEQLKFPGSAANANCALRFPNHALLRDACYSRAVREI
jgi:hypothetical protein